jgi:hypothetical protein
MQGVFMEGNTMKKSITVIFAAVISAGVAATDASVPSRAPGAPAANPAPASDFSGVETALARLRRATDRLRRALANPVVSARLDAELAALGKASAGSPLDKLAKVRDRQIWIDPMKNLTDIKNIWSLRVIIWTWQKTRESLGSDPALDALIRVIWSKYMNLYKACAKTVEAGQGTLQPEQFDFASKIVNEGKGYILRLKNWKPDAVSK